MKMVETLSPLVEKIAERYCPPGEHEGQLLIKLHLAESGKSNWNFC